MKKHFPRVSSYAHVIIKTLMLENIRKGIPLYPYFPRKIIKNTGI